MARSHVLHTAETHGRVSTRVNITMHSDLKILGAGETWMDYTPMVLSVCQTRPKHMPVCLPMWTLLGYFPSLWSPFNIHIHL